MFPVLYISITQVDLGFYKTLHSFLVHVSCTQSASWALYSSSNQILFTCRHLRSKGEFFLNVYSYILYQKRGISSYPNQCSLTMKRNRVFRSIHRLPVQLSSRKCQPVLAKSASKKIKKHPHYILPISSSSS